MYRTKTKIIIIMMIIVVFMAVGYAILSTSLNINGSTAVTSNWQVEFSDIRTVSLKGGATNKVTPTVSKTTANFEVDLVQPGDEVTYEIDITNYGDIEAEVKGATYTGSGSEAIYVRFDGVRKGTRISSCEGQSSCPTVTITLRVGYDPSVTSDPEEKTKDISITLDIGQYVSSSPTPDGDLIPEITYPTLVQQILSDNEAQSDNNIDFSQISSDTNGKGLYYTRQNTENNGVTYYFRGAVDNNYVSFAGFYWRIIRINEDGSVRLIYQGLTANSTGTDATIGTSVFNSNYNDNAYVGYMYGTPGSTSYEKTHANINDSIIKGVLDAWYEENLIGYSTYLADSGFCGDRSLYSGNGYGTFSTTYGAGRRLSIDMPQFKCPQSNDLYTTKNSNKGNKALDYPIGLITADEVKYAGGESQVNKGYYLYADSWFWTMSPSNWTNSIPLDNMIAIDYDGNFYNQSSNYSASVRPVINLKSTVEITSGDGTSSNPYIIKTS